MFMEKKNDKELLKKKRERNDKIDKKSEEKKNKKEKKETHKEEKEMDLEEQMCEYDLIDEEITKKLEKYKIKKK